MSNALGQSKEVNFDEEYVYEENDGNLNYEDCYGKMNSEFEVIE